MNRTITSDDFKNLFTNKHTTTIHELLYILKDLNATTLSLTIDNYMVTITDIDKVQNEQDESDEQDG